MTNNPALFKLLRTHPERIMVNDHWLIIVPDGLLEKDEVEMLRKEADWCASQGEPFIANFLPDDIRPEGVKKL